MTQDLVLAMKEVATPLKIGGRTAYSVAQQGKLPGFKAVGQWRFRWAEPDAWIDSRRARGHGCDRRPRKRPAMRSPCQGARRLVTPGATR